MMRRFTDSAYTTVAPLLVTVLLLPGCDGKGTLRPEPGQVENNIVFTLPEGGTFRFRDVVFVWCGPWEEGHVEVQTLHIMVGFDPDTLVEGEPIWNLRAVISDVASGQIIQFPNTFIWNEPEGVDVFVGSPYLEYSTQGEGSSGSLKFQKLEPYVGGEIQFSVDAYIAREYGGGGPVRMTGTFRARIGGSPQ
jgi:hypothetical protein